MIKISNKKIDFNHPCFIIAEAGVNHNGDIRIAKQLIDAALTTGADAVKFQTFNADLLVTPEAEKAGYQKKNSLKQESHYHMLKKLELPQEAFGELSDYAREQGIIFFSSPFDTNSVDILEKIHVPAYKIPSGEITNLPLLTYIARKSKPVILSTGMATYEEIDEAVGTLHKEGAHDIILLYCVTSYPAKIASLDLTVIPALQERYRLPVGFSDHTTGIIAAIAARTLGACIIEKHFTLDTKMEGPDHKASMNPGGFKKLVSAIRSVESVLGNGRKSISQEEREIMDVARKSLVAAMDIAPGTIISSMMVDIKRPGSGLSPKYRVSLIGKRSLRLIRKNELFSWDMVE